MQKAGPQNNIYLPNAAQQQAGFAQHAQLTHAYHTRSAAAAAQQVPATTGSNGRGGRSGAPNGIAGW